jgi:glutathione synthase/RimK-type ligase-like ATP-grasp enzyme
MTARIALVTTDVPELLEHEFDLEPLLAEFARRGIPVEAPVWHDASVDWAAFDLIVMRSPWDYSLRTAEFLAWLDSLDSRRVLNPPALIRWNFDKRYLLDLEALGVSIVPTTVASSLAEAREAAEKIGGRIVVKPNVGAGSWGAHITQADDPRLAEYVAEVLDAGKLVLVEPEVPEITAGGEHGLLFFDGAYSHAITKGRILADDGGYEGGVYNEDITPVTPSDAEVELATRCSEAIATIAEERGWALGGCATPLYARYDVVTGARGPMVIEAELFEPSYFVDTAPGSVERAVDAMVGRLESVRSRGSTR